MSSSHSEGKMAALALAAMGVVYGDIGTSPLYALHEIFGGAHHPVPITPANVLGILSVIFWSLMIVVSLKYVAFIMRANNRGEGGIMALMSLALRPMAQDSKSRFVLMTLGLFGAALFYGDGIITPAISVLSAVEGLEIATPAFKPYVIPISLVTLIGLFIVQRRGTATVGVMFGPIMIVWFILLAVLGILSIAQTPDVLAALNPVHGLRFLSTDPVLGFFSMGATVLVLTGAEALYADMGHFGQKPIQYAWFGIVLPALLLNYYGQGALLLRDAKAIENPFYLLAPGWMTLPLVVLSTVATVIASQAVISGAFSITQQAIQLGFSPRMEINHTSDEQIGQIYLPGINWTLLIAVIALVVGFGSSTNLAAAYGIAVTGTMFITDILAFVVARYVWGWSTWRALLGAVPFVLIDLAFFSANSVKIHDGGWFPLAFGLLVYILLSTWQRGRMLVRDEMIKQAIPMDSLIDSIDLVHRVEGTAVFMTSSKEGAPPALLHNLKHNKILHERVVLLTVQTMDTPYVAEMERIYVHRMGKGFLRVLVRYGFMESPDIPGALDMCKHQGERFDLMDTTFYLSRETLVPSLRKNMLPIRARLFTIMTKNATAASDFFKIPSNRVVELGTQLVI